VKEDGMGWAWHAARMREKRNEYSFLVGNQQRKRPLGRLVRRCEDNIKMHVREIGWGGMD
jgi:hypothetical protein